MTTATATYTATMSAETISWNSLPPEIRAKVAAWLPLQDCLRACACSKETDKVLSKAHLINTHIKEGKLPEKLVKPILLLLDCLRIGALAIGCCPRVSDKARRLVKDINSMHELRTHHLYGDLLALNTDMYSFWDADFTGKANTGVYAYVEKAKRSSPDVPGFEYFHNCRHWRDHRVFGQFYLLMDRPDGSVFVSADMKKVYLVIGIKANFCKQLQKQSIALSTAMTLTFLPFEGN